MRRPRSVSGDVAGVKHDHHDAATHASVCHCGRRARWHVDCAIFGCGNFCGIHARAIQRRSLWTAVFGDPIIIKEKETIAT